MKIIGDKVVFKSTKGNYFLEETGVKPCTIRFLSQEEADEIRADNPKFIAITRIDPQGKKFWFRRRLNWWGCVDYLLGIGLYVFCWEHDNQPREIQGEQEGSGQ